MKNALKVCVHIYGNYAIGSEDDDDSSDDDFITDNGDSKISHIRNQHKIHVYGTDIPEPVCTFEDLETRFGINPQVIKNIQAVGYQTPTPIQMQAIPAMCQRRELMACAPTGSGKTAAFIIPLLHHLKEHRKHGIRALVLAPTRELGKQIHREFQRLSEGLGLKIQYIQKASTAAKKLGPTSTKKCDILVSTPNRLIHMLKQDSAVIDLSM
ncbi:hypothetical protein KUTeg_013471 [Tegillarca granosa]|uniref:ATP-dependent RNA helicase n=1 Tax=Tegillarca granosa TaxID=220873 RepID=A0ABQ9EX80_TEGGR|nr:hypothetical protein KUTeg_013471 [Tegillarca granosa]